MATLPPRPDPLPKPKKRANLPRIVRAPGPGSIAALRKRGYKKAGPKYGRNVWVLPKAKAAPKPAAPAAPRGPYEQYRETAPWAIGLLQDMDRRQQQHEGYVSGQVMPWLSQGLAALTGVNPAAPGYNPTIQQQYLANVQGAVGGAMNAAAAATPAAFQATAPGAPTTAPGAFMGQAMQQYAAQRGGAALMGAQAQQALQTLQPNVFAQGAMRTIADYAKGLPAIYVEKRNERRAKIDQWVAEQEFQKAQFSEQQRAARVDEAIRAMNSQAQVALGFGQLGLSAEEAAGSMPSAPPTNLPPGFVAVPNDQGGWDIRPDPSFVEPGGTGSRGGTSTRDAQGRPRVPTLQEKGFIGGWKNPTKARKAGITNLTQAADGLWYGKRPKGGGAATRRDATDLAEEFREKYAGSGDPFDAGSGGWVGLYRGSPTKVTNAVTSWVLKNKLSFTKSGGVADVDKLRDVLGVVGGPQGANTFSRAWAKLRPRIDPRTGKWK